MALINVAIKFGDEYFCFGINFSNIFFVNTFFENFFFKISFPTFFFKIVFLKFFFTKGFFFNFKKKKFPTFFQNLFFEGFTLDASPFTETKRTLCICVMKNMISKRSKLDFSLV